jgi:N-acetylmuramoyl-L-alanine amidase
MRRAARALLSFLLLAPVAPSLAAVTVHNLRQWQAPDHTRLVFDLSAPVEHRLFTHTDPARIVVELDDAVMREALPPLEADNARLAGLAATHEDNGVLRVTLELKTELRPRSFVLKPVGPYGHRLVIDLYEPQAAEEEEQERIAMPLPAPPKVERKELLIAIDAGHGGEDPGAIGRRYRTREKDVTLAIARELARLVEQTPGMRPVLIRKSDYYIKLEKRFDLARRAEADVFVSIHADSVPGRQASGSSVYVLSQRGASSAFAMALANRENFSDLVGGLSLNDKHDDVRRTLLDLSQSKTIEYSLRLADDILGELRRTGPVHLTRVQQAGFMVLKSPDIPSVLVETAFISNPTEEKKLRTPSYQREVAAGILAGIRRYLARHKDEPPAARPVTADPTPTPPSPPAPGERQHIVRRGETLTAIARRYRVHVDVLRFANTLNGDDLAVGMRLRIPPPEDG